MRDYACHYATQAMTYWDVWDRPGFDTATDWVEAELANLRAGFRWANDRSDRSDRSDLTTATAIAARTAMLAPTTPSINMKVAFVAVVDHVRKTFDTDTVDHCVATGAAKDTADAVR